jgi:release factor glutamine methyltransferase
LPAHRELVEGCWFDKLTMSGPSLRLTDVGSALAGATRVLRHAGSSSPRLDAELLLLHVLAGVSRAELMAHPERTLSEAQETGFRSLVARRAACEPMAYILGQREFYGRMFVVDRRALIPRPETELLVELGLEHIDLLRSAGSAPRVLEVGTGTGAVAISLAAERTLNVIATDVSFAALQLARENACRQNQLGRVRLVQADLVAGLFGPFDVVVANLPYVPNTRTLPTDVLGFEPHVALFGGPTGTELIQRLLVEARPVLAPGGVLCVELDDEDQAARMAAHARALYPVAKVTIRRDAGGYDRVVHVRQ